MGEHILKSLEHVEPDKVLRLTMLLHDIGKPAVLTVDEAGRSHFHGHAAVGAKMAGDILRRLKFDNDTIRMVHRLVQYHDYGNGQDIDIRLARRALHRIGEEAFPAIFAVKKADIYAQSEYMRGEKLSRLAQWQSLYKEILEKKQCVSLKTLAVGGSDLLAVGWKPGKDLGEALQRLLELVLEEPERNTKEWLLAAAEEYRGESGK